MYWFDWAKLKANQTLSRIGYQVVSVDTLDKLQRTTVIDPCSEPMQLNDAVVDPKALLTQGGTDEAAVQPPAHNNTVMISQDELNQLIWDSSGYKQAFEQSQEEIRKVTGARDAVRTSNDMKPLQRSADFSSVKSGHIIPRLAFSPSSAPGSGQNYVICNSIPKAGSHLIEEIIKSLGLHSNFGYFLYPDSATRLRDDLAMERERSLSSIISVAAMEIGYYAKAHLGYCQYLEQLMLQRQDHKMIFVIRDPRDIVISWTDFVFSSSAYVKMRQHNALLRKWGSESHPDDESRVSECIRNLPASGIGDYLDWQDSPACLTVRFEDLLGEIQGPIERPKPVLRSIAEYLAPEQAVDIEMLISQMGRGGTESGRHNKVGVWKSRMNAEHKRMLLDQDFERIVVEYGYAPTSSEQT